MSSSALGNLLKLGQALERVASSFGHFRGGDLKVAPLHERGAHELPTTEDEMANLFYLWREAALAFRGEYPDAARELARMFPVLARSSPRLIKLFDTPPVSGQKKTSIENASTA